ncbi:MAG: TonB-dependent receptor [Rhodothermales bacterium]|nr:TonB-dependent receptor [Rhodothermales bacterium]
MLVLNKRWLQVLATFLLVIPASAQRHSISGLVTDAETGESLIGANIHAVSFETGTVSNAYGFYSVTLPEADSTTLVFSYIGYDPQVKKVYLTNDIRLDVSLQPAAGLLDEVTVTADASAEANVRSIRMSVVDVPIQYVERLPAILGEADVLKVIQLLPGVQAGNEGTTGYHVRGGANDQNLVLMDEAIVYNPNHLFGLVSTFNSRALNNVELVKGGFPAQYGGRLSSVLKVSMREGNRRQFDGRAGIGLVSSHMTLEGPILQDKLSYMVSGRRSYLDVVMRPFQKDRLYYLYDLNGKVNYQPSPNDHFYLSGFQGRDVAEYTDASGLGYGIRFGNSTGTFRWNHIFGSKLFSNFTLVANEYFIRVNTIQGQFYSQNYSGIKDLSAKASLEYYPAPRHHVRIGGVATRHRFRSTGTGGQLPTGQVLGHLETNSIPEKTSDEFALYVQDDWNSSERIGLSAGVRLAGFDAPDVSYSALEPRLSVRIGITPESSLKASYTVMNQFVHLVPSTTASLPTDIWTPASKTARPQKSAQYALGLFRNLRKGEYEASVEGYYKEMNHQVLFREGTHLLAYDEIDSQLTFGRGWSYGAEFFLKRRRGRLNGWISYTLSWTRQRFADLNRGEAFPFRYDRRHNLALVGTYDLSERWSLSGNLVLLSGSPYTLPVGRVYGSQGGELYQGLFYDYDKVNNYRMANYHRLDLAATRKIKTRWFKEGELVLSTYNTYSRRNPYFVYLALDDKTQEPVGRQISLLPIVPSISYNVRF